MPKVLKIVGTVITVAVLTIATAGFGAALAVGGASLQGAANFGLGLVASLAGTSAGTLIAAGTIISAVGGALQKPPNLEETENVGRNTPNLDPNTFSYFVFGETVVNPSLIFEEQHGTNNDTVTAVFDHAAHKIQGFVSLHANSEAISFSGDDATGAWAGALSWKKNLGTASQSALSLSGSQWPSTAKGAGHAHSGFQWTLSHAKLSGGIPQSLSIRVQGALCYDPRLDTTAGGSGSHRYDDPDTWSYSSNAALVLLRYIIGERAASGKLLWGVGENQDDVDLTRFIAMANVADELRDGIPRYRLGGIFETSNDHDRFFRLWEANTGGKVSRFGGKRSCFLPHDDLISMATLSTKDRVAQTPTEFRAAVDPDDLLNTCRGRINDPANLYQPRPYPEVVESTYETEDGGRREHELDFAWVQDFETAERLARMTIRRSRYGRRWILPVNWAGELYPPFSILTVNLPSTNNTDVLVRVVERRSVSNGVHVLTLQEENASIYDDTPVLGTVPSTSAAPGSGSTIDTATPQILTQAINGQIAADTAFHFKNDTDGMTSVDCSLVTGPNVLTVTATGPTPRIVSPTIDVVGAGATKIRMRIKRTAGSGWDGDLFYHTSGHGEDNLFKKTIPDFTVLNQWVTVEYDMADLTFGGTDWVDNTITKIRIDLGSDIGDAFEVNWIIIGDIGHAPAAPSIRLDPLRRFVDDDEKTGAGRGFAALDSNTQLNALVRKNLSGVNRSLAAGLARETYFDGDSINFTNTWQLTPDLQFGGGALSYKQSVNAADQQVVFQALNPTVSGATASIRLKGLSGTPNVVTETTETVGTTPSKVIEKTVTNEAGNDNYTFRFTVNGDDCEQPVGEPRNGFTTVGFYVRKTLGGPWTQLNEVRYNTTGTFDAVFSIDGMGQDSAFGIHEEDTGVCGPNGLSDFVHVRYDTAAVASDNTGTPTGADPLGLQVVGEQDQV